MIVPFLRFSIDPPQWHQRSRLFFLRKSQVFLGRHDAGRIRVTFASAPALHADNQVALVEDTQFDSLRYAPFETLVHVLLPIRILEIGLRLGEKERVDSTVKVRILLHVSVAISRVKVKTDS